MKILVAVVFSFSLLSCTSVPKANRGEGCESPLGFIPEGQSAPGYLHPVEQNNLNCEQGVLTCTDGAWSGAYIYPSCTRLLH